MPEQIPLMVDAATQELRQFASDETIPQGQLVAALHVALTGLVTSNVSGVLESDTILQAIGKLQAQASGKVDKVAGKALSSNDFTDTERVKLANIAEQATKNAADAALRDRSTHTGTQPIHTVEGLSDALATKLNHDQGAAFVSLNSAEQPSQGGLRVFQSSNLPDMMPDDQWHSLIRVQHPGYPDGYWQDLAMSFTGGSLRYRANANGVKTPWKLVANTEDVLHVANTREPSIPLGDTSTYWRGDKTWQVLNKVSVGLSNVDNTSDADKPVSNAQAAALWTKLNADSATTAGFIGSGDEMYMRRSTDAQLFGIANKTAVGPQNFKATVLSPQVVCTGPESAGFTKQGTYDAGGGLLASRVLTVEGLDNHNVFALLRPGVSSYWRFDVAYVNFHMKNTGTGESPGGWAATSDNRVKYDARVIEGALDKVEQLTGYTYLRQDMFNKDGTIPRRAGLIAQDVLKVLPETLNIPANYDAVKNQGDLLTLSQDGITALLVNAVKELRQEVNALKEQLKSSPVV